MHWVLIPVSKMTLSIPDVLKPISTTAKMHWHYSKIILFSILLLTQVRNSSDSGLLYYCPLRLLCTNARFCFALIPFNDVQSHTFFLVLASITWKPLARDSGSWQKQLLSQTRKDLLSWITEVWHWKDDSARWDRSISVGATRGGMLEQRELLKDI